jgi:hypothetical protein
MSFDLQFIRDRAPTHVVLQRQHAIYLDAQRSDRKVRKARNVADLLERGHRARSGAYTALVIDVKT